MVETLDIQVEGYKIQEVIKQDESSIEIFRGIKEEGNVPVILKRVLTDDEFDPSAISLKNEYDILSHLKSEKILKVYELQHKSDSIQLIMEDSGGTSLDIYLKEKKKLTITDFLDIGIQIVDILAEIHAKKVIHKDIKSQNIIINNHNSIDIIDFGISTRLSKEEKILTAASGLEGSVHYISPEQTGRMNRSVDYRSDFYSLGVVFYELLTGKLPFDSEDILELIHYHLAKNPIPLHEVDETIPPVVSKIILKLMEKNAENRYLTAMGIKADLEKARANLTEQGTIADFALATEDFNAELQIPEKLYARDKEIERLMDSFHQVAHKGFSQYMLIAGYSGIGKSALVKEIHRPLTKSRGNFITGKYEQYNKNTPFNAILSAFTSLIRLIITEPEEVINDWKEKLQQALGANGRVMTDVIPELEYIIGKQPEVADLDPRENSNRFYTVFLNFIKVFADKKHPLAIFLDDLQWADNASIELLKSITNDVSIQYLYIMLAYRDNEVDELHPLTKAIQEIKEKQFPVEKMELLPLGIADVAQLLADTFNTDSSKIANLAEVIYAKTKGNPFFINELLKKIVQEEFVYFSLEQKRWQWQLNDIQNAKISENVVELLIAKVETLTKNTRDLLLTASCIGNQFQLDLLANVLELDVYQTERLVREAIDKELIFYIGQSYKYANSLLEGEEEKNLAKARHIQYQFQHDKIRQAAYELLDEKKKRGKHLKIGRELLENLPAEKHEEQAFSIVAHFNYVREELTDRQEIQKIARLNLIAGIKAKDSIAYDSAEQYIQNAFAPIDKRDWQENYEFAYQVYREMAEILYLNGKFDESEKLIQELLKKVKTSIEKSEVYYLLMFQYIASYKIKEAIDAGKNALSLLGIIFPEKDLGALIGKQMEEFSRYSSKEEVESIYSLPEMKNHEMISALKILSNLSTAAYLAGEGELWSLIALQGVKLSIEHGNHPYSALAYLEYGLLLTISGDHDKGYHFGKLSNHLSLKWGNLSLFQKSRSFHVSANFIYPWKEHIKNSDAINEEGFQAGLDSGNLLYAGYVLLNQPLNYFYEGRNLDTILDKIPASLQFARKNKDELSHNAIMATNLVCQYLVGNTRNPDTLDLDDVEEESYLKNCYEIKDYWTVSQYLTQKAQLFFYLEKYENSLEIIEEARKYLAYTPGLTSIASTSNMYYSLSLLALYSSKDAETQKEYLKIVEENQQQFKIWVANNTDNFEHKYLLVEAELQRIKKNPWQAFKLYEQSTESARKYGFVHNEALAYKLQAYFWQQENNETLFRSNLFKTFIRFEKWGAKRLNQLLQEEHSEILRERRKEPMSFDSSSRTKSGGTITTFQSTANLDLQSVIKSSNAISSEIKLERLLEKLISIVIENAGAQRGILLLKSSNQLTVEAIGSKESEEINVLTGIPLNEYEEIAASLVNYVERTRQRVVLSDASSDSNYQKDQYIKKQSIKSLVCFPIIKQGELSGILYLENNLTEDAFTPERLKTISILSSQAAISIDNALLYANLEDKVRERTEELALANEELGEKNRHITDSINYAQTIQKAILPSKTIMSKSLKDFTILFLPKDIVSGDFFWFAHQEEYTFVAAVDCTGHGVPGAFMSMIGNSFLNQIVNEMKIWQPDEILTQLNEKVRTALKQDREDSSSRDGMDMCLVRFSKTDAVFAGAKRPLYIVKNGVIETIKGDRDSIGGKQKSLGKKFTNHTIPYTGERTMFYLTSDGFADQPNEDRKKIGSRNLTEILSKIADKDGIKQRNYLEEYLTKYRGSEEQRDDITVIGVMIE